MGQSLDDKDGVDWFNYMQMRAPDDDELERCFWHSYGYYVEVLDDYFIVNTEDEEDDTDGEPLPYSDEAIYWYGESLHFLMRKVFCLRTSTHFLMREMNNVTL